MPAAAAFHACLQELVANFALNPHLRARTDTWKGCISTRAETLKFEGEPQGCQSGIGAPFATLKHQLSTCPSIAAGVGVSVSSAVKADAKPDASHWDAQ